MADGGPVGAGPLGSTRIAAVIGSPVRHSRSPQIANAAFAAAGVDWSMVAFEVAQGAAGAAVDAVRSLGLGGLMVTMPHKADIIGALDRVTPEAAALDAVNSVAWVDGELVGDNTDGAGLVASLRAEGADPRGQSCLVLGAGGAARSVIQALALAGAAEVAVLNRSAARGEQAAALAAGVGRVGVAADVTMADLVINATSVGMGAGVTDAGPLPIDADQLRSAQVVVDLVYEPRQTPLLRAAAANGAHTVDGLGMLVHQAALTVRRWIGVAPDLAAMSAAATATR